MLGNAGTAGAPARGRSGTADSSALGTPGTLSNQPAGRGALRTPTVGNPGSPTFGDPAETVPPTMEETSDETDKRQSSGTHHWKHQEEQVQRLEAERWDWRKW